MKIIQQGAEAIIKQGEFIIKERKEKSYRIPEIDEKIRKLRTRSEAKLLEKASEIIPVPKVIKIDEEKKEIHMEYIKGKKLSECLDNFSEKEQIQISEKIAENIAKLHDEEIIHGDLTTSNMLLKQGEGKIYFIDFGLGFVSRKYEDKAVDLYLLKQALASKHFKNAEKLFDRIVKIYAKKIKDHEKILQRLNAVERRRRYRH